MSQQWFYTKDGKSKVGPLSAAELQALAKSGQLVPTDMLWKEGLNYWALASKVKGLFAHVDSIGKVQAAFSANLLPLDDKPADHQRPGPINPEPRRITRWQRLGMPIKIGVIGGIGLFGLVVLYWVLALITQGDSPTAVVQKFCAAANDGRYSEAERMLSKEGKDALSGPLGLLIGGLKAACDLVTKNGTISSIEPISEKIRGEGATVVVTLHYKDGSTREHDATELLWRDGRWQITLGTAALSQPNFDRELPMRTEKNTEVLPDLRKKEPDVQKVIEKVRGVTKPQSQPPPPANQ